MAVETPETAARTPAPSLADALPARTIGLILLSVLLGGVGQLLFKAALDTMGALELSLQMLLTLLSSPLMWLGLVVYAASALLWLLALIHTDLSLAYPFLSLTYVIVLVGGVICFDEHVTLLRLAGVGAIVLGLFIIARSSRGGSRNDNNRDPE